ncbi:MAG: S1C family serine protease [Planctomycetota bacterium]
MRTSRCPLWPLGCALLLFLASPALRAEDEVAKKTSEGDAAIEAAARRAVEKAAPAIVEIETLGAMPDKVEAPKDDPNAPGGTSDGILAKKGFKQAFGPSTGVVVGKELVITSTYALKREPRHIFVTRSDGKSFVATVLGKDEARMLALLKVPGADLTAGAEAKKDTIKVGRTALAVGKGYGVGTPTVSQGLVSAVDRASGKAIQTSANVSPACYGGPLVSLDGEIMGVCVPLAGMGGQAGVELYDCGIGFAIPIEDVRAILPRLEKGETLKPAFLGVVVDQGRTEDGILIESVQPKSPADKAGLEDEDVIIEVDGKKAVGHHVLNHAIGKRSAGDKLKLVVLRGKERVELEAKLAEAPKTPPRPKGPPGMPGPGGRPGPNPPGPNPPGPAPGGDDE